MRIPQSSRSRRFSGAVLAGLLVVTGLSTAVAPAAEAAPTVTSFTFPVDGTEVTGMHYRAAGSDERPVVIMALGFGCTQDYILPEVAPEFVSAGYDVVTFDYRYWGLSGGQPRNLISIDAQLADWRGAVAASKTLPGVDGNAVALWGTSLAGGHVLSIGSENIPGVKAVVAQSPHTNGLVTISAIPAPALVQLTGLGILDLGGAILGQEPLYIPTAAAPGTTGLLPQAGALDGYQRVLAPDFDNKASARVALQMPFYSPDLVAQAGRAPTFIANGLQDNITPGIAAQELRARMRAEGGDYPGGHFDVYPGGLAYPKLIVDEIAFLKAHVPTS